jgi:hypothetical protein
MPFGKLRFFSLNSRTTLSLVFLGCLSGGMQHTCCAQTSHGTKVAAPDKTASLLIRDAESLPPEFAADIVLQVVETDASLSASQKIKALKNAFDEAAQSQDEVLRRPWGSGVEETSEGLHALALSVARLDRISQQSAAVQDMAEIDPKLARVKLGMIALPRFDPPPCYATWLYFPDAYYEAVARVITAFSPKEISSGQRGEFLRSVVSRVVSQSQLPPVTRLITASDLSGTELANVMSSYIYVLDGLRGDAHSFYWMASGQSVDEFAALVARLDKQGIVALPLITSFRRYLVANFKGPPCTPFKAPDSGKLPTAVQEFNDKFSTRLKAAGSTVITDEEIKNESKDTSPTESEPPRWDSKEYSDLLLSLQKLPDMPREKPSIEANYQEYLLRLNGWSNQSEPETEFFHQKSLLYFGVIERLGPSALRTNVLTDFVKFLEQNSYQQVSKVDWFLYTRRLIDVSTQPAERSEVINALISSGDPVLNLYGRLESWKSKHTARQASISTDAVRQN